MAYAFTVTEGTKSVKGGKVVQTFEIQETDVAPADEWSFPVPNDFEVTLYRAEKSPTAGAGTTLTPELGRIAGWTSGLAGHIVGAASASANHRIVSAQLAAVNMDGGGLLYGRSVPDVDTGATAGPHITTWITIARG